MVSTPQMIGQSSAPAESATDGVVAAPALPEPAGEPQPRPAPDPTRYGDWEKNGRCIDF